MIEVVSLCIKGFELGLGAPTYERIVEDRSGRRRVVEGFGLRGAARGAPQTFGEAALLPLHGCARRAACLMSHVPPGRSHVSRLMSMRRFPFRQQRISARDPNAMLPSVGPQRGDEARAR